MLIQCHFIHNLTLNIAFERQLLKTHDSYSCPELLKIFQNQRVNHEAARARAYLEAHVNEMTALYDLAITSYALAKAGSSLGAVAIGKLDKFAHLESKYISV